MHKHWLSRIKYLFSKEFWRGHNEKILTGRIILLNKCHPNIPDYRKFRPIRICSNIVKLMEKYLMEELRTWVINKCKRQFGFVPGVGCEVARHRVFG